MTYNVFGGTLSLTQSINLNNSDRCMVSLQQPSFLLSCMSRAHVVVEYY